jgi:hypothetical protein
VQKSSKRGRGRPASYKPEFAAAVYGYALLGGTNKRIGELLGVDERTVVRWQHDHPDFCLALKAGRDEADAEVSKSLFHRANGYSHKAVKIFCQAGQIFEREYVEHFPPDVTACIFWLKNRRPDLWRDLSRQEITGADGGPVVQGIDPETLKRLRAAVRTELTKPAPLEITA